MDILTLLWYTFYSAFLLFLQSLLSRNHWWQPPQPDARNNRRWSGRLSRPRKSVRGWGGSASPWPPSPLISWLPTSRPYITPVRSMKKVSYRTKEPRSLIERSMPRAPGIEKNPRASVERSMPRTPGVESMTTSVYIPTTLTMFPELICLPVVFYSFVSTNCILIYQF